MKYLFVLLFLSCLLYACGPGLKKQHQDEMKKVQYENPAAEGFDEEGSDLKAMEIADKVMLAMGGRRNWDKERYFKWNFFGARSLWWDKLKGDVRIHMHNQDSTIILLNIFDDSGKVFLRGQEATEADTISKYVEQGKGIWINDSYWLFMPFKLKDSGVTLTYVGEDTTQSGLNADVLQLVFTNVGNTPQNKYHIWVDKNDHLVKQWSFFREHDLEAPNFITPWEEYKQYGSLLLSGDRGKRKITEIEVAEHMEPSIFHEF